MVLYAIVFSIGLSGLAGAPWWAALVGACVLGLYLIHDDRKEAVYGGDAATWEVAQTLSSVTIATIAAPLAFGVGRFTDWIWL